MARNYIFAPDEYYHVYARGFEKSKTFRDDQDRKRFIECLYLLNTSAPQNIRDARKQAKILGLTSDWELHRGETLVHIGAYCLMPNHFHILVREKDLEGKGVSKFMQKLMTSYTMYFNKRYERTGSLFSSSFKAQHVVADNHLKYLFSYIHLNPKKVTKNIFTYPYSSILDYMEEGRPQSKILEKKAFPDYFEGDLQSELEEWLNLETDLYES